MGVDEEAEPRANSSSISRSLSFADIDRYNAVTEYRFDWRTERPPSCEDIVFWRLTGMKEDEDEVEAREGAESIGPDMADGLVLPGEDYRGAWTGGRKYLGWGMVEAAVADRSADRKVGGLMGAMAEQCPPREERAQCRWRCRNRKRCRATVGARAMQRQNGCVLCVVVLRESGRWPAERLEVSQVVCFRISRHELAPPRRKRSSRKMPQWQWVICPEAREAGGDSKKTEGEGTDVVSQGHEGGAKPKGE